MAWRAPRHPRTCGSSFHGFGRVVRTVDDGCVRFRSRKNRGRVAGGSASITLMVDFGVQYSSDVSSIGTIE